MGTIIRIARFHHTERPRVPKTAGSAQRPDFARTSEKMSNSSDGMRLRAFQFETADVPTPAKSAAAAEPPIASTTSSTDSSMSPEYSRCVNLSMVHRSEMETAPGLADNSAMQTKAEIAQRLRDTFAGLNLTQVKVATRLDVSTPSLNNWLTDTDGEKRIFPIEYAVELCTAYRLTLDWIYRGESYGLPDGLVDKIVAAQKERRNQKQRRRVKAITAER